MNKLFGVTVAMTTPFGKNGEVDYKSLEEITEFLISRGVNCLYPCGTTGEMVHLSAEERERTAETVVRTASGRVNVFIHCGAMCQEETVELVKHAHSIGADGAGVVTPIFLGVNDRELEEYYASVAEAVPDDFPLYLYNIPQCAGNDLKPYTARKIAEKNHNYVGIKYSLADINRTMDYLNIDVNGFSVLHGCDRVFSALLMLGCDGTVSGVAGIFPEPFVEVYKAYTAGNYKKVQQMQKICVKFCDALRCGSNMSFFKEALKMRGLPGGYMRKPQLDLTSDECIELNLILNQICIETGISFKIN